MSPDLFIKAIGPDATAAMKQTGIPASVAVAQAALESGWGASTLAQRGKNLFGIKADPSWKGPTVLYPTIEYVEGKRVTVQANWRVYVSWKDSMVDHIQFLYENPRYLPALRVRTDPEAFTNELQACGYATDPSYAAKINSIRRHWDLDGLNVAESQWALLPWAVLDGNKTA